VSISGGGPPSRGKSIGPEHVRVPKFNLPAPPVITTPGTKRLTDRDLEARLRKSAGTAAVPVKKLCSLSPTAASVS
jgi:hypothetical protein